MKVYGVVSAFTLSLINGVKTKKPMKKVLMSDFSEMTFQNKIDHF